MSGIIRRTVLCDASDGYIRPLDFARVVTGIGEMLEAKTTWFDRVMNGAASVPSENSDMITMINDIEMISLEREKTLLSSDPVHGGNLWPRTGR